MPRFPAARQRAMVRERFPAAYQLAVDSIFSPSTLPDRLRSVNLHNHRVLSELALDCNCCGSIGKPLFLFLPVQHFERMGISPLRDNIICGACKSSQRTRAVLDVAVSVAMASMVRPPMILDVDDTWSAGEVLKRVGTRQATTYDVALPWGSVDAAGTRNEDLSQLTFPDATFDLVVSAEVQEHIEDTWTAFAEVFRVLKPGGVYVFTAPFRSDLAATKRLAVQTDAGLLWTGFEHLHGDPRHQGGIPSFWLFGSDLAPRLCDLGFAVSIEEVIPHGSPPVPVSVVVAKKPGGLSGTDV